MPLVTYPAKLITTCCYPANPCKPKILLKWHRKALQYVIESLFISKIYATTIGLVFVALYTVLTSGIPLLKAPIDAQPFCSNTNFHTQPPLRLTSLLAVLPGECASYARYSLICLERLIADEQLLKSALPATSILQALFRWLDGVTVHTDGHGFRGVKKLTA